MEQSALKPSYAAGLSGGYVRITTGLPLYIARESHGSRGCDERTGKLAGKSNEVNADRALGERFARNDLDILEDFGLLLLLGFFSSLRLFVALLVRASTAYGLSILSDVRIVVRNVWAG